MKLENLHNGITSPIAVSGFRPKLLKNRTKSEYIFQHVHLPPATSRGPCFFFSSRTASVNSFPPFFSRALPEKAGRESPQGHHTTIHTFALWQIQYSWRAIDGYRGQHTGRAETKAGRPKEGDRVWNGTCATQLHAAVDHKEARKRAMIDFFIQTDLFYTLFFVVCLSCFNIGYYI